MDLPPVDKSQFNLGTPFRVCNASAIALPSGYELQVDDLYKTILTVNGKLSELQVKTKNAGMDIFEALDFRMFSGLVGETLVLYLQEHDPRLRKNPNIDGYPDLLDVSKHSYAADADRWLTEDQSRFINYCHGGIEIKNTFGTKKQGSDLAPGERRIKKINKKPDWKAHHTYTNRLLAIMSDFIHGCPQVVAAMKIGRRSKIREQVAR